MRIAQSNRAMPEEQQASVAPPPAKSKKSLIIGLLVFVVIIVTVGSKFFLERSVSASHKDGGRPKAMVHLESLIVNLADHDEKSFLRIGIDLGIGKEIKEGKVVVENIPNVRDTIISVLAACKSDELLTVEGKRQLKENLLKGLTERVPELEVREVYFTDFLVQR